MQNSMEEGKGGRELPELTHVEKGPFNFHRLTKKLYVIRSLCSLVGGGGGGREREHEKKALS